MSDVNPYPNPAGPNSANGPTPPAASTSSVLFNRLQDTRSNAERLLKAKQEQSRPSRYANDIGFNRAASIHLNVPGRPTSQQPVASTAPPAQPTVPVAPVRQAPVMHVAPQQPYVVPTPVVQPAQQIQQVQPLAQPLHQLAELKPETDFGFEEPEESSIVLIHPEVPSPLLQQAAHPSQVLVPELVTSEPDFLDPDPEQLDEPSWLEEPVEAGQTDQPQLESVPTVYGLPIQAAEPEPIQSHPGLITPSQSASPSSSSPSTSPAVTLVVDQRPTKFGSVRTSVDKLRGPARKVVQFFVAALSKVPSASQLASLASRLPRPSLGSRPSPSNPFKAYSGAKVAVGAVAGLVFVVGMAVTLQTLRTNRLMSARLNDLSKQSLAQANSKGGTSLVSANTNSDPAPVTGTAQPTSQEVAQYTVAPDAPRYLKIRKLGVNARVKQATLYHNEDLTTPANVYDAGWYIASAKPGQPGATLINGHVARGATHGIFYNLKSLVTGDTIQVERGDRTTVTYRVVTVTVYSAGTVDIAAALAPITAGKSGLNLIACPTSGTDGSIIASEKRVVVFASQL